MPTVTRSIALVGSVSLTKWSSSTIRIAKPRTPSSAGRCPPRSSRGLVFAGMLDITAPPGFYCEAVWKCPDLTAADRREPVLAIPEQLYYDHSLGVQEYS